MGDVPSGKHTKNYGKSPFLMGKSTISMAIFNSYVKLPEGTSNQHVPLNFKLFVDSIFRRFHMLMVWSCYLSTLR